MDNLLNFTVLEENDGTRIDVFLSNEIEDISRNSIQKIIQNEKVTVNNKIVKSNYKCKEGDKILVEIEPPKELDILPQKMDLNILYEDDDIIIINKEQGVVVHPAPGHYENTLVNGLMYHCGSSLSGINGVMRPGIVHRIDKDTSGILVIAKNDTAHRNLVDQLSIHSMTRVYNTVVFNNIKEESITINAPIGRHPIDRKKMCVTNKNSKNAITHIKVLERFKKFTFAEARLETGRTHQIRVHMSYIGHPLLGDTVYGSEKQPFKLNGQVLHARVLGFNHPRTNKYIEFSTELPDYFKKVLNSLKLEVR